MSEIPFEVIIETFVSGNITLRKKDNYVSTHSIEGAICKKWKNYVKSNVVKDFIEELAKQEGLPSGLNVSLDKYTHSEKPVSIVESYKKGPKNLMTMVHRLVAIQFAQTNPKIGIPLGKVLDKYIRGDLSLIQDVVKNHDQINNVTTTNIELNPIIVQDSSPTVVPIPVVDRKRKEREDNDQEEVDEKKLIQVERQVTLEERKFTLEERKVALTQKIQDIERGNQEIAKSKFDFKILLFNELINNGSNKIVKDNARISKENLISLMCQQSVSLTTSGHSSDSNQQVSLIEQPQTAPLQQVQIQLLDDSLQEFSVSHESQAILK
jgi:hypothetical protein